MRPLLARARGARVCYEAFDAHVVVAVPDEKLCEIVKRLFPAYVIGGDAPHHSPAAAMVLSRVGTNFELETSVHATPFSFDSLEAVIGGVEFALMETFLFLGSRFVQLHASGIVDGDHAIIALGGSGRGKSSLALTWCLGGKPVLGDDAVFVDERGLCHPFKRQFKVDPAILRSAGIDPRDTPFWKHGAEEAWFDPGPGGWAVPTRVSLVALLQFEHDCDLAVREVARSNGLNALLHSRFASGCAEQASFHRLAQLVERVRVVDVRFSSAADAAQALVDYVP